MNMNNTQIISTVLCFIQLLVSLNQVYGRDINILSNQLYGKKDHIPENPSLHRNRQVPVIHLSPDHDNRQMNKQENENLIDEGRIWIDQMNKYDKELFFSYQYSYSIANFDSLSDRHKTKRKSSSGKNNYKESKSMVKGNKGEFTMKAKNKAKSKKGDIHIKRKSTKGRNVQETKSKRKEIKAIKSSKRR